jgi:hypothetical protein
MRRPRRTKRNERMTITHSDYPARPRLAPAQTNEPILQGLNHSSLRPWQTNRDRIRLRFPDTTAVRLDATTTERWFYQLSDVRYRADDSGQRRQIVAAAQIGSAVTESGARSGRRLSSIWTTRAAGRCSFPDSRARLFRRAVALGIDGDVVVVIV